MPENDLDALMPAITGEPAPAEALRDPGFAAEHAAAAADVALLRERLGTLGATLAADPGPGLGSGLGTVPALAPPGRIRARRRSTVLALGAVAATLAAVVVGGLGWLVVDAGPGGGGDRDAARGTASDGKPGRAGGGDADLSPEGFVACSRLIVEGTVTAVDPVPGALQDRVTVDVTRYLKPASGSDTIRFPMDRYAEPRLRRGDRVLVTVDKGSAEPANWAVGTERDRLRTMILKALPAARKITCGSPPGPGD
ncbi:hypothetical protein ABZS76_13560 [Streptomyces sp. NPDC005562]|uniref:hypothetical protein n=1 Tax=Streptomyces sp. NPDC005562 TaxID=3154890 RepID=UPI0033B4BB73